MKTKLNYLLLIGFLFFSGLSFSQEKRFVEVTVSDTTTLKFTQLIYEISMGNNMDYLGIRIPMGDNDTSTETTPTTSISTITMLLDKEKFMYTLSSEKSYAITSSKIEPTVLVVINNEKELKKLYAMFKSQTGITGKIKDTTYEPISKYNEMLFKRLYSKAMLEATQLAAASGNNIGQLIFVSEVKIPVAENYMDMYSKLLKGISGDYYGGGDVTKKVEEVTKTFRFELK